MSTPMPGGTQLTRLAVYDWPAPDGVGLVGSGAPHLHTVSTEAYVVLGGHGSVHTITPSGAAVHELRPGVAVWFTAGTVHRAVNDGDLDVLVVMSDAGLAEAGDAVLTFPGAVLADPERYRAEAALPRDGDVAAAARHRRDLAIEGLAELYDAVERIGPVDAMARLHAAAERLVGPAVLAAGRARLARPAAGEGRSPADLMSTARVAAGEAWTGEPGYGMCGRLRPWPATKEER
ncbi:cupin domain-containing protein [Actinotalea sp. M2MS4P-6]|uniref:cupin domain-containing protein n=1 Tax=Actinotalea sp. M2MS4P-6 TaxID=2983762 RepID=UPI0021E4779E|nr:cupin domain-containing protein [Actinotalea sp. M2MS4P-6]MCV2394413.1 cupin domain-containing protein [Actinotalea sp. M2MS4P-6]